MILININRLLSLTFCHGSWSGTVNGHNWVLRTPTVKDQDYIESKQLKNPLFIYEVFNDDGKRRQSGLFGQSWTLERAIEEIQTNIQKSVRRWRK